MNFEFVPSEEFYKILYRNSDFCEGIGKVMLSAGRLETTLRAYLKARNIKGIQAKSTLGTLVRKLKQNNLLSRNGEMHFDDLALKRNYLAHSLYDLFSAEISESILPRSELTEMDTDIFVDRVHMLAEDFLAFAELVSKVDLNKDQLL